MNQVKPAGAEKARRDTALLLKRQALAREMGLMDDTNPARIQVAAGLSLFMSRLRPGEWSRRRQAIMDFLWTADKAPQASLANQKSVRVRNDEAAWYLFLCDQFLNDPLCNEASQAQRILPYFAAIGDRAEHAHRIKRLDQKIDDFLRKQYKDPDGVLFEIMVAFAYAEAGWDIEFLEEGSAKTPDMLVSREGRIFHVECKRLSRRTDYAERERIEFLKLWDEGKKTLVGKRQNLWFKGTFHVMPGELPVRYLRDLWTMALPIADGEHCLVDDQNATIWARPVDLAAIRQRIADLPVNALSGELSILAGGNWAPENSSVTVLPLIRRGVLEGCPPSIGTYVDDLSFICGFSREFDSLKGNDKKAKDIVKLLSDAVQQVTKSTPSIIHIAAETFEGAEVERIRTEKIKSRVEAFNFGEGDDRKRVALVKVHRFQTHQRLEMAFEADESIDSFPFPEAEVSPEDLFHVPINVLAPSNTPLRRGVYHWDIYS